MAVDLNYEKDSKERIPYEHYLEVYQNADPKEISSRCDVPYDAEKQEFTVSLMREGDKTRRFGEKRIKKQDSVH